MKTIAENANDFADLRTRANGDCVYVDKTDYFHRLVSDGGRNLFFIARPRRFGKSLMLTTFKYIFEGRRELFKGLKIDHTDYDWKVHPVGMLYQTGYLTIKDYEGGEYLLGIPDEEVRRDLLLLVAAQSAEKDATWVGGLITSLLHCEFDDFFDGLKSLFAHLPYGEGERRAHEMNFERNLKILFWAFGLETVCEDHQTGGRADIVVKYRKAIYVFELKRDEPAAAALAQIKENGYAKPYLADGRPVWAIGLSFDSKTRQLVDAKEERLA